MHSMPRVALGRLEVSRLIVGGNPFSVPAQVGGVQVWAGESPNRRRQPVQRDLSPKWGERP